MKRLMLISCVIPDLMLTTVDAVDTLRLAHEAIQLPHLSHGKLGPSICLDYRFDLLSQWENELGVSSEMV